MKLPGDLGTLTYCLNIHPTQNWAQARAALLGPVVKVKAALAPHAPFACGLRFSAETLAELADPRCRLELHDILAANDLHPVTMNGFPYGPFHGTRVKEQVYLPDWRSDERVAYTTGLADLLAELNPEGSFLSLSTVPGAFKSEGAGHAGTIAANILRAVCHLVHLERRSGRRIALAIEPEPACFIETIDETVAFFEEYLFCDAAARQVADATGLSVDAISAVLPRHLGLCYDVCHAAVEFENAARSIAKLRNAGIPIHKLQLSSALRIAEGGATARAALARFNEPTYLHQVVTRSSNGHLTRFTDLEPALSASTALDDAEWRVHFHVPIFLERLPEFDTTQNFLREILTLHLADPISPHLEVETYTWSVLPENLVVGDVHDAVTRELRWVLDRLGL